jgi:hypothetical protein
MANLSSSIMRAPEFNTNYSHKSDKVMRIINYFKRKMITHNDTTYFDKCYSVQNITITMKILVQ